MNNNFKKESDDESEEYVPKPEDFLVEEMDDEATIKRKKRRRRYVKWIAVFVSLGLFLQVISAAFPTMFNLDALRFLKTSYQLYQDEEIQQLREAVVTIQGEGMAGRSKGTGFLVSSDGLIVTNHHVIEGHDAIAIGLIDGSTEEAEVISTDEDVDLAFLKINRIELPYLKLHETSGNVHEPIVVIGNPLAFTRVANEGYIYDQTDRTMITAPIYRGNSGSPVMNQDGDVVAVVYATTTVSEPERKKVGLAIPIEEVWKRWPY